MSVVKTKVIKPVRLKEKEMRLELLNGLRKVARGVTADFKKTTATWKNQPEFETIISLSGGEAGFLVGTNNKIYEYIDQGTRPHIIRPKNGRFLAFASGYKAKTSPGVIGSRPGGATSNRGIFAREVRHPGTKPRLFSKTIAKNWERRYKAEMHDSMKRAAKKSGHAVK